MHSTMNKSRIAYVTLFSAIWCGAVASTPLHAAEQTTSYTYNSMGLVTSVDGARTDVADITQYEYDDKGNRIARINALGHTTRLTAYDSAGRVTEIIDPNGLVTHLEYDLRGQVVKIDKGGLVTAMQYDPVGNLTQVTSADGTSLHYSYDKANRLIAISDDEGNRIDYTLDAMGNRTSERVYDASNNLVKKQQKTFDEIGRLLSITGAEGQVTTFGYDRNDNLVRTTDPKWQTDERGYDALDRLVEQVDPNGGITRYGYDAGDQLTSVTDPNGNTTVYVYDGLGNLIEQSSPDTGTTTYTHDAAGNVLSKMDAKGQTTSYQYDALNRLTSVLYADGSTVQYEYDSADNGIGRLASITEAGSETAWQYDQYGHVTRKTQAITVDGAITELTTRWQYNSAGQLAGMTYPSGLQVDYQYSHGHISALSINGEPLLNAITYQAFGGVSSWYWGNGSQSLRGYDLDGRLIEQTLGSNTYRTLSYDANGNITTLADEDETKLYGYDALDRLSSATAAQYNLSWQYDANGNRIEQSDSGSVTPYGIDPISNRLLAVGESSYQYDANGNLTHDGEHSYQYDAKNRLVSVDEGQTAEYRYNALGQRTYKKGISAPCDVNRDGVIDHADLGLLTGKDKQSIEAGGPGKGKAKGRGQAVACVATQMNNGNGKGKEKAQGSRRLLFAYDEHRLLGEYGLSGNPLQETVWLGNLPVATMRGGSLYYIHADHLGTPRVITDSSNTEVWQWNSDPFGNASVTATGFEYNLRFPGQYYDEETGRHYNYFRDYDPATGRYIQSDPIGLDGGMNTYTYTESNPIRYIDPLGKIAGGPMAGHTLDCVRLRFLVWLSCKAKAEKCRGTDDCATLKSKFDLSQDCVYFQTQLTKKCYASNPSHGQVVTDALNRGKRCLGMILRNCTSCPAL